MKFLKLLIILFSINKLSANYTIRMVLASTPPRQTYSPQLYEKINISFDNLRLMELFCKKQNQLNPNWRMQAAHLSLTLSHPSAKDFKKVIRFTNNEKGNDKKIYIENIIKN